MLSFPALLGLTAGAAVVGTDGDDEFHGTYDDDTIDSAGNDEIYGQDDDDMSYGDAGHDALILKQGLMTGGLDRLTA